MTGSANKGKIDINRKRKILFYMQTALKQAHYELLEDEEPFYGEVTELEGVWATGKTLEACRNNLMEAIEDWLLFSIAKGLPIFVVLNPTIDGHFIA
jgi:predicted RNase H-like HicB family nuclease